MKNNNKGFSLPLAMGIVIVISLLALTILEYIVPFSRDIKGVENSSKAYYAANSGIEEGLYHISSRTDIKEEKLNETSGKIRTKYATSSSGNILPPVGEGNSDYDNDWNIISSGNPIQLSIGNGYISNWTDVNISFRVPNLDNNDITSEVLSGSLDQVPIVNWQISSKTNTLNSNDDIIKADQICESDEFCDSSIILDLLEGKDLYLTNISTEDFYIANCQSFGSGCTLKFSIVNRLVTNDFDPISIPYLEWKLDFDNNELPLRYSKIESSGTAYGFKKELDIKVAAQTVNEAFDFTVFQ